jgi:hypothetical protein
MVPACGQEHGLIAVAGLLLEAEHAAVEVERALDVRHLQVHVADVDSRIDGRCHFGQVTGRAAQTSTG